LRAHLGALRTPKLDYRKIIFMGLDNAGKTSIILTLMKGTNLLTYYSLKPTPGLEIQKIENELGNYNIWDFGGQEKYRYTYLDDIGTYFEGIDRFLFVIDVQDEARYGLALEYLKSIVSAIKSQVKGKQLFTIKFSVFLHKFDPILEMSPSFNKNVDNGLTLKVKKIIPSKSKCSIYKTTIFTLFKKTEL